MIDSLYLAQPPCKTEISPPCTVNDIHAQLNRTDVSGIARVSCLSDIESTLYSARSRGAKICIAGGRHAMGGQQFGNDGILIDTRDMKRVLSFDRESGIIEVEAGICWPDLIDATRALPGAGSPAWGIRQKQTGADMLSLGGSVAANVHGRGLAMKPFVHDIESLVLVDPRGRTLELSQRDCPELFSLVAGGYGLFGVIYSLKLRLARLRKLRRTVEVIEVPDLMSTLESHIASGALYGDFQFAIDNAASDFMHAGICSTYHPVDDGTPVPDSQRLLSVSEWAELLELAHHDKSLAYSKYRDHYLKSNGQIYFSDTHQLSTYVGDYHRAIDRQAHAGGSEIITEIYVPRSELPRFFACVRRRFRDTNVDLIYGTVRLIEKDDLSFMPWAREPWACTIFNLHSEHTAPALARTRAAFRFLIDTAIACGGSYYLTYHRFATARQLLACHPRFADFVKLKQKYDPDSLFLSDWYRHYMRAVASL